MDDIRLHALFGSEFGNGPGTVKYYINLGIAVAITIFMKWRGQKIVLENFGAQGGRNLEVSGWQAFIIVLFTIATGIYLVWIIS
ncbi:MAG: hypothetical protein JNL67_21445 [Planctomycetaceae bacterium]|nr:hypothetical protein [Planctomycetaceae bacterium]